MYVYIYIYIYLYIYLYIYIYIYIYITSPFGLIRITISWFIDPKMAVWVRGSSGGDYSYVHWYKTIYTF